MQGLSEQPGGGRPPAPADGSAAGKLTSSAAQATAAAAPSPTAPTSPSASPQPSAASTSRAASAPTGAAAPTEAADPRRDHRQLGVCLAAMAGALGLWGLVWPVPTEVMGQGVLIYPGTAGLLNARAAGQVRELRVRTGDRVRRGDVLMTLHLPVLERQLLQQRGNLAQLERQNRALDARDAIRLDTARVQRDTALAKLADDRRRYAGLQVTYASKLKRLQWLVGREVVAPLASEVVTAEQGLTSTSVALDGVVVSEKEAVSAFQKVKLEVETAALQRRYQIDDLRREIQVTRARLAYDGDVESERDGVVLDLQVIPGQTVTMGQRLGTIGRPEAAPGQTPPLQAVAYFAPADARRLPLGLPVEVVPQWNQRGRFGGIVGRVTRVLTLPATPDDIATTTGNPQLAEALAKGGPVLRSDIELLRDPASNDGYRWTLSAGSAVFPVREGLTLTAHAYVEWRSPISYLIPGLRSLTGGFRRHPYDRRLDRPFLRQP